MNDQPSPAIAQAFTDVRYVMTQMQAAMIEDCPKTDRAETWCPECAGVQNFFQAVLERAAHLEKLQP